MMLTTSTTTMLNRTRTTSTTLAARAPHLAAPRLAAPRRAVVPPVHASIDGGSGGGSIDENEGKACDAAGGGRPLVHDRIKGLRRLLLASRKELEQFRTESLNELAAAVRCMWDRETAFVRKVSVERNKGVADKADSERDSQ